MSLLALENIVKEYKNKTIIDKVSLHVERGEKLALIGPNGSGKTTLLKIAMGLETSDSGNVVIARNIKTAYLSQSISDINDSGNEDTALSYEKVIKLEREIKEIEKQMENISDTQPDEQEKLLNDYSELIARYEAMDGYSIEIKIKKILKGLGLRNEALTLPLNKLSGGEKMRVSLARVLLEEPDLLILDEPTNHLDIQSIEWLEEFIKKFEGGVLVVSHDRYFINHVATRIAELQNGSIIERSGNYKSFMEQKKIMRDFSLKEQNRLEWEIKNQKQIALKLKSMRNISGWKSRELVVKRKEEMLQKLKNARYDEHLYKSGGPKLSFAKVDHTSKDIAEVKGLTKKFGSVTIFSGAEFSISGGERLGIIGPNGCGKTTLINILLGIDKDYEGHVRLGEWVKYSYISQEISFENENRTMIEEIISKKEMDVSEVLNYLSKFQFYGDDANKKISVLSGGERVRLYLACVMLEGKNCLIMDEPTNHLDVPAREALESALLEFKGTLIAVTHDRYFLNNCVNRILEISGGKIYSYDGNYENYTQAKLQENLKNMPKNQKIRNVGKNTHKKDNIKQDKKKNETQSMTPDEIEAQIIKLEQKASEIEASFQKSTPPEVYAEYNEIQNEIEKLYSLWNNSM